ncbi:MAG: hypothetical protein J6A01_12080 [Proteobacteria bacterium]|nr:hypothetical protein [Pseudomonadota bacterium]
MSFKRSFIFAIALCIVTLVTVPAAFAVDKDDDIAPDSDEHIAYDANSTKSAKSTELESKFPAEAKEVQAALEAHINHANARDLDGYMSDFVADRMRYPELEREYAQRAMALKDLHLEVHAVEFALLTKSAATIHTRQISRYTDDKGKPHIEDAVISYRWLKNGNDWKIAFTERKHLVAE